jgi:hypothetical protein
MSKSDHWHVGRQHAANGEPRYKFQDPHLQKEYDEGYNQWRDEYEEAMPDRKYNPQYNDYFGKRRQ